jgi:hypothetical protein
MNLTQTAKQTAVCVVLLNISNSMNSFTSRGLAVQHPDQVVGVDSTSIYAQTIAVAAKPQALDFMAPETTPRIWLINRMKALQQRPPPTLQKVRTQWKASAEVRRKLEGKLTVS